MEHSATGVRLADARLTPGDPGFSDASGFRSQLRVVWEPHLQTVGVFEAEAAAGISSGGETTGPWRPVRVLPPEPHQRLCSAAPLFFLDPDGQGKTVKVLVRPRPWRPFAAAFARPAVTPDDRAELISVADEEDGEGGLVWAVVVRLLRTLTLRQRDADPFSLSFVGVLRDEARTHAH